MISLLITMIFQSFSRLIIKEKEKNLIGQTLCAKAPWISLNQPVVQHTLCITIHMSHGFALGTLDLFLFSPEVLLLNQSRAASKGDSASADSRPKGRLAGGLGDGRAPGTGVLGM